MEKIDISISRSSKIAVLIYLILFYLVLFGGFIVVTYLLIQNLIVWINGNAEPIILLIVLGLLWILFILGFSLRFKVNLGIKKGRLEVPNLFKVIDEISDNVDSTEIDEVYIAPNSMIGTTNNYGIWTFLGKSEVVFIIGYACLGGISVQEFKSLLAHEYAHFSNKFDTLTIHLYKSIQALRQYQANLNQDPFSFMFPVYYILLIFNKIYPLIGRNFSRECEFMADKIASYNYGSEVFRNALLNYSVESILFENNIYRRLKQLNQEDIIVKNVYAIYRKLKKDVDTEKRGKLKKALLESDSDKVLNPYPTISERITKIENWDYPSVTALSKSANELFRHRNRLESDLSLFLNNVIMQFEDKSLSDKSTTIK